MGTVFKLLSWFYNVYPVKKYLRKRISEYFLHYHISKILHAAKKAYKINQFYKINDLKNRAAFRGLMNEIFKVNDFYPSSKDIAIAINISFNCYSSKEHKYQSQIIDLAYHISREIKERIISDQVLKSFLLDLNKDLNKLNIPVNRLEIEDCFNNKKKLFINYFNTFNDPQFSFGIKIWHQGEDISWIDWKEKDSIIIKLDRLKIREGFFLPGFDYSIMNSQENISIVSRVNGYEYFNDFDHLDNVIWAR